MINYIWINIYQLDKSFFALENGIFEYRNVEQIKFSKKKTRSPSFLFNFSKLQICCMLYYFHLFSSVLLFSKYYIYRRHFAFIIVLWQVVQKLCVEKKWIPPGLSIEIYTVRTTYK